MISHPVFVQIARKSGKTETQLEGIQVLGVLFVLVCVVPLYGGVCVFLCTCTVVAVHAMPSTISHKTHCMLNPKATVP